MTTFERMHRRTIDEIDRRCPRGALEWIAENQPEIRKAIAEVEARIDSLRNTGNQTAMKKALRILYKLHLEGFKRFRQAREERLRKRLEEGFSQEELESFRALGMEILIRCDAGEFWLVPKYTGSKDRVEMTPEDALRVGMVPVLFNGKIESIGLDTGGPGKGDDADRSSSSKAWSPGSHRSKPDEERAAVNGQDVPVGRTGRVERKDEEQQDERQAKLF